MDDDRVAFVEEPSIRSAVAAVYESVRAELAALVPDGTVEHIGATSVPGSLTKGDLDVCVQVDRSAFQKVDRVLGERFARNVGSDRTESLSSFVDDSRAVPVGVQLVARGGPEDFFLRWRDLLRRSPAVLREYDTLKRRWHGRSHDEYRAAKSKFIEETFLAVSFPTEG